MADIIIGRAKVISIEEVNPDHNGVKSWVTTDKLSTDKKAIIVSKLRIESYGQSENYTAIEGIMAVPALLPFGKIYELTLHDPGLGVMDTNGRAFRDSDNT